jgi:hypothetical protein
MDNHQLDRAFLRSVLSNDEFIVLIKKYAGLLVTVILVESALDFGVASVPLSIFLSEYSSLKFELYLQIGAFVVTLIANLVVAITVLQDMRRIGNPSWVLFGLTLLFKEIGVLFFMLFYVYQKSKSVS